MTASACPIQSLYEVYLAGGPKKWHPFQLRQYNAKRHVFILKEL